VTSVRDRWQMQCPKCSSDHELYIVAEVAVLLDPDGSDEVEYPDWTDNSVCKCGACGFHGTVRGFSCSASHHSGDCTAGGEA